MEKIVEIGSKRTFTHEEAEQLLPLIYKLTEKANAQVKNLMSQMEAMKNVPQVRLQEIESEIQSKIDCWQAKVQKLGGVPKGYWLVDFDNGSGYFCWKFPEKDIKYAHGYQEGFTGRKELSCNHEHSP
ncbi:MAG: DUF2203 domain-containing protein [Bdellovibrionales bacterium]